MSIINIDDVSKNELVRLCNSKTFDIIFLNCVFDYTEIFLECTPFPKVLIELIHIWLFDDIKLMITNNIDCLSVMSANTINFTDNVVINFDISMFENKVFSMDSIYLSPNILDFSDPHTVDDLYSYTKRLCMQSIYKKLEKRKMNYVFKRGKRIIKVRIVDYIQWNIVIGIIWNLKNIIDEILEEKNIIDDFLEEKN